MHKKESGQAVVEYAIILGFVSVCVISALTLMGDNVSNVFNLVNTSFSEKIHIEDKEDIEVYEYKVNDNFLGFYANPDYEAKYQNVAYFLIVNGNKIELTKGANIHCPAQVYCAVDTNMKVTDLIRDGAMIVMESNGKKVLDTPVWDF